MNIHEAYGRLAEKYERELAEHRRTVALLLRIKAEPALLARLTVDGDAWALEEETAPKEQERCPEKTC